MSVDLVPTFERPAWQAEGLCNTGDAVLLDVMFPRTAVKHKRALAAGAMRNLERAKRVCAACPVRAECLDYALTTFTNGYDLDGVWGGTDALERAALRAEIPRRPPGANARDGCGPRSAPPAGRGAVRGVQVGPLPGAAPSPAVEGG